jgi:VWFA-related protein
VTRVLAILLVALAVPLPAAAQRGAPPLVHIDAIAVDARGRFVTDLKAEDLRVVEDDVVHPVEELRLVRTGGATGAASVRPITSTSDERAEANADDTRLVAIFLDEYHVAAGPAVERVRDVLESFIERTFSPRDLLTVVKPLDSLTQIRLTRDRDALEEALSTFEGRKGDYEPRSSFEQSLMAADRGRADALRAQVATSAVNALALHLGSLRGGRKTLIVVSEGFGLSARARAEAALPSIETIVRSANRAGVSIYTIDPRALVSSGANDAPGSDALRALAQDTDGAAILTASDVTLGFERIARDSSEYYVVGFRPRTTGAGRLQTVEVRSSRADVVLRARSVYAVPPPVIDAPAARPAAPVSPVDQLPRRLSPLIRAWFGFERAEAGSTRVQFTWQPGARVGSAANPIMPALVTVKVLDRDGALQFEQLLGPVGSADGLPTRAVFDVPAGRVVVQATVENEERQVLDTDLRDLTVPAFAEPAIAFGTPQVFRASNAAEFKILSSSVNASPIVTREFSTADHLLIRVPVYGLSEAAAVAGVLYAASGEAVRDVAFARGPEQTLQQADLPLAGLAAGSYYLEFTAAGADAAKRERVAIGVRR